VTKSIFKYKYKFKKGYNPVYVNGAYGGVTHQEEIILNFFLERMALPRAQEFEINEDKVIDTNKPIAWDPIDLERSYIRYVQNGIILDLKRAKIIRDFLNDQIKKLEEQIDKNKLK